MRMKKILSALLLTALPVSAHAQAIAMTQCQSNVEKMWAGDGAYIWVHLANGGSAIIAPNDPNREAVIAMTITAMTTERQVVIRYAADNVACRSQGRTDLLGMYLL